ncbi:MAG: GNAT family N-acetyltransferase [Fimbriimonadaceae bacterium]|nr:GNAT family N-acetyltransferase [Fimbriimonadaceae bacterium]
MERWIRVRTDEEYEAYAQMRNAMFPFQPTDGPAMRTSEERSPPAAGMERYLLARDEAFLGAGIVMQAYFFEAPGLFIADVFVPPGRAEVFASIHERVAARAHELGARRVRTMVSSLVPECIAVLEARGYEEVERFPVTCLELETFDPSPFGGTDLGEIDIVPLTRFIERHPDDWLPRIWRFDMELSRDMPFQEKWAEIPLETYRGQYVDVPSFDPALHFVALSGEVLAGITMLNIVPSDPTLLGTGLTGVHRAYRRRGLATALKLRAFEAARARGVARIVTENESSNPMLDLNVRLGFRPVYDEVVLARAHDARE